MSVRSAASIPPVQLSAVAILSLRSHSSCISRSALRSRSSGIAASSVSLNSGSSTWAVGLLAGLIVAITIDLVGLAQDFRVRVESHSAGPGRKLQRAMAAGHRNDLALAVNVDIDRHGKGETARSLPLQVEGGSVPPADQARQVGLAQINVEEPTQVAVGFLARDRDELIGRTEARLEIARPRIDAAVDQPPSRSPECVVADQRAKRMEHPARLVIDVVPGSALPVVEFALGLM